MNQVHPLEEYTQINEFEKNYVLGKPEGRECVLMYHTEKRRIMESIEHIIKKDIEVDSTQVVFSKFKKLIQKEIIYNLESETKFCYRCLQRNMLWG